MLEQPQQGDGSVAQEQKSNNSDLHNPSRRRFLKAMAGTMLGAILSGGIDRIEGKGKGENVAEEGEYLREQYEYIVDKVWEEYGITVRVSDTNELVQSFLRTTEHILDEKLRCSIIGRNEHDEQYENMREYLDSTQGTVFTDGERVRLAKELYDEMELYPKEFLRMISAEQLSIVLSADIVKEKDCVIAENYNIPAGLTTGRSCDARIDIKIALAPSEEEVFMQYVCARGNGVQKRPRYPFFQRGTLHHELMHRIDQVLFAYNDVRTMKGFNTPDEVLDWKESHNLSGGAPYGFDEHCGKGFFHDNGDGPCYAQADPLEDRAEIFRALMEQYSDLMRQAGGDSVLFEKVSMVKMTLEHLSDGVMDDEYWNIMATGDRDAVRAYVRKREREKEED